MAEQSPGIGHNVTSHEQVLRDNLQERYRHFDPRTRELLDEASRIPETIDEALAEKVSDFIKAISSQLKAIEGARKIEKDEYLKGGQVVDGIFRKMAQPLIDMKATVEARLGVVLKARDERKRKEAEEKARIEREAAEERRRLAEEQAERDRQAAAEARARADEAERIAAQERERRRQEAEAARRREEEIAAQARKEREEEERKQAEARAARQREIDEAAERRRKAEEEAAEQGRKRDAAVAEAKRAERELEKRRKEAEEQERINRLAEERRRDEEAEAAEQRRKQAERDQKEAEREAERKRQEAERADKQATRVEAKAERAVDEAQRQETAAEAKETKVVTAKPGEFGKVRGDFGALGTLRQFWTHANIDRDALDLESLRQHIPMAALDQAVRSFIDAGGRELVGVDIYEDNRTQVR